MDEGTAYSPALWSSFFSAQVSAGAALTGLLFVAMSINLQSILEAVQLMARAAKALSTSMLLLLVAEVCLVPAQPRERLGWELVVVSFAGWAATLWMHWKATYSNPYMTAAQKVLQTVVTQASVLPFLMAGVSLVSGRGGGLY